MGLRDRLRTLLRLVTGSRFPVVRLTCASPENSHFGSFAERWLQ
jgi:hypothetical protein